MNLIFTLSLEQRALASVAIALWSQNDVRDLMSKSALHTLKENLQEIEKAVIKKSFKLLLPALLKEKLLSFIARVGFQILSWVEFHHCNYRFVTELPAIFVWTSLGTINNVMTAKLLVMGGTLDDDTSFALACMYCLEEEIKYCWNMFNILFSRTKFKYIGLIISYWFCFMYEFKRKERLSIYSSYLMTPHTSFLLWSMIYGNEAATKYFFKENMEKKDFVGTAIKRLALKLHNVQNVISLQRYSDVMMLLLSKMNAEQYANTIVNYSYALLKCLLVWPWHSLLLEMAKDKLNSLSNNEYNDLLNSMVDLMHYDHNLHKLFGNFWQQSPKAYKQFFIYRGNIVRLLIFLFKKGDEKNVKLILKDSSTKTKKKILKIESIPIFVYLISSKNWLSIEYLFQECLSSQEDWKRFRDGFKNRVHELLSGNEICKGGYSEFEFIEEYQWTKFFQLVDSFSFGYNKKRLKEDK